MSTSAQTLNAGWAKEFEGNVYNRDVAIDDNGNVYTVGGFFGATDFAPGPSVNYIAPISATLALYITKFDASGNLLWVKVVEGTGNVGANDIAIDSSGNVCVTGSFEDTVDFDPGPGVFTMAATGLGQTGSILRQAFVLSLNPSGSFLWAAQLETFSEGTRIFVNVTGDICISGNFAGTVDFDPGPATFLMAGGLENAISRFNFLWKLKSSGEFIRAMMLPEYYPSGVDQDPEGNICLTGRFSGFNFDFDPGPGVMALSSAAMSGYTGFITKFDTAWNLVWAKKFEGPGDATPMEITTDAQGNIYTRGWFSGSEDFDLGSGTYMLNSNLGKVFISRFGPTGAFDWAVQYSEDVNWYGHQKNISADQSGNLYFADYFIDTVDFDPGPGVFELGASGSDAFITKLDPSGSMEWAVRLSSDGLDELLAVKVDDAGRVYCVGKFNDTMDFDPGPGLYEVPVSVQATFIMKLPADSCSNMGLVLDSLIQISCADPVGVIGTHAAGGSAPYSYAWNSVPPVIDPVIPVPASGVYELNVTDNVGCTQTRAFVMNPGPPQTGFDLNLSLVTEAFQPGFPTNIYLDAFNDGCIDVTGAFKLALDTQVNYTGANPVPDQIVGDTLIWNFSNMNFDDGHFTAVVHVTTDVTAILGSSICITGIATPDNGDANVLNNIQTECKPVTGSYDPNDIAVYPPGACEEGYIAPGTRLTYKVRFQNTGTASAVNVAVLDSLDVDLNPTTIKVLGSSHPMYTEILPGNVLKFRFDNIMLPDSNSNEPASHGYLIYEIDPDAALANGTEIYARADIYFDFNSPVLTNTIRNTVIDPIPSCIVSVQQPKISIFKLYPNPASSSISVIYDRPGVLLLTDITGRVQKEISLPQNSSMATIDISGLVSGMYTYSFITKTTRQNGKLVIIKSN